MLCAKSFHLPQPTMVVSSFYMTLPSNSSMTIFPNNTVAEYKVKLPEQVDLSGNWEVGLASITFTHTWFNISKENEKMTLEKKPHA